MILQTERLILRPWCDADAESLFAYAKDERVGPAAGWLPHKSIEDSLQTIHGIFSLDEMYAVCLKEDNVAIGSIGLLFGADSCLAIPKEEAEIGYWIGVPFWGRGLIPEATRELIRHAFEDLHCECLWCAYFDGNERSKRAQEKCGFVYHHTEKDILWETTNEICTQHVTRLTKREWINNQENEAIIRPEKKEEYRAVENLVREAFWNVYRPGCSEHLVLHVLRDDPAFVRELDFVMEQNGRLIGQNVFVRAVIDADDGRTIPILTMGPICITPELKRKGYGKKLLDYSLQKAAELGFGAVLFEGNIDFYGKSGFAYASNFGIRYHDLPEGADASFFLCRELIPGYLDGVTGVYQTPQSYYVADADVEEFDKDFSPKVKLKLPGQIFE